MSSSKLSVVATILLAIAVIITAGYLITYDPPSTTVQILPPAPTPTDLPTATPAPIEVYIVGEVENPQQSFTLPPGSRVEDAIAAAGGLTENANLDAINPVQVLRDGDMIFVPPLPETGEAPVMIPTSASSTSGNLININTASAEELQTLPGIGAVKAQDIIDHREANGPFRSIDDLVNVAGFGERTVDNLRPYITAE